MALAGTADRSREQYVEQKQTNIKPYVKPLPCAFPMWLQTVLPLALRIRAMSRATTQLSWAQVHATRKLRAAVKKVFLHFPLSAVQPYSTHVKRQPPLHADASLRCKAVRVCSAARAR